MNNLLEVFCLFLCSELSMNITLFWKLLMTVIGWVFDLFTVTDLFRAEKSARQLSFRIFGGTIKLFKQ